MDSNDLFRRFDSHSVDDDQAHAIEKIRTDAKGLALNINDSVPEGREKSLAITKLEEVVFWANAGIARQD